MLDVNPAVCFKWFGLGLSHGFYSFLRWLDAEVLLNLSGLLIESHEKLLVVTFFFDKYMILLFILQMY